MVKQLYKDTFGEFA